MVMLAVTTKATPVFNTPQIDDIFSYPFSLDHRNLLNPLETVLYPNVQVQCQKVGNVYQITTDDYPSQTPIYIHPSFVSVSATPKKRHRPSVDVMKERLINFPYLPYIWGGTFPEGISSLFDLYPPKQTLTPWEWSLWQLRGIDCSGLIYNVTHGTLPRNTGPLWKSCHPIKALSQPLDLIFTPGHVMIYLGNDQVIESRQYHGIYRSKLKDRIEELEVQKEPYINFGRFL